jgi:hypothetical protein
LKEFIQKGIHVPLIFWPAKFVSQVQHRPQAQAAMFEGGVIRPLVALTRNKMQNQTLAAGDAGAVARHRDALLALIQLQTDKLSKSGLKTNAAQNYVRAFISYLTDTNHVPDVALVDTFNWTYRNGSSQWPPTALLGGDHLTNNVAIQSGLEGFRKVNQVSEGRITNEVALLDKWVDALIKYRSAETNWLTKSSDFCSTTNETYQARTLVEQSWTSLQTASNSLSGTSLDVNSRYSALKKAALDASSGAFKDITKGLDEPERRAGIIAEIQKQVESFGQESASVVSVHYDRVKTPARELDANYLLVLTNTSQPCFRIRSALYGLACTIEATPANPDETDIGDGWQKYAKLKATVDRFRTTLAAYNGPLAPQVIKACNLIAGNAQQRLEGEFVDGYRKRVLEKLDALPRQSLREMRDVTNARTWFAKIEKDLVAKDAVAQDQQDKLSVIPAALTAAKKGTLASINNGILGAVGFPVVRAATKDMNREDLKTLKFLLEGLRSELEEPVWRSDVSGAEDSLLKNRDRYARVVSALGKDEGSPAEWELWFVPADSSHPDDGNVLNSWRQIQVTVGAVASDWTELPGINTPTLLGKGPVDQSLRISFRKIGGDKDSVQKLDYARWGMPRTVCKFPAGRSEDGMTWKFQISLVHVVTGKAGNVTVEVRAAKPLPKIEEDWP